MLPFVIILVIVCGLLLTIVTLVAAIRSRKRTRKIVFTTIAVLLAGVMVFTIIKVLIPPSLTFVLAAPVPSSLTTYFVNSSYSSDGMTHFDLAALRVTDGSTRFVRNYSSFSHIDSLNILLVSDGVEYTEEINYTNTTETAVLKAWSARDGSALWQ